MQCPKCGHEQKDDVKCEACGIYFQKYEQAKLRRNVARKQTNNKSSSGVYVIALALVSAVIYFVSSSDDSEGKADTPSSAQNSDTPSTAQNSTTPSTEGTASSLAQQFSEKFNPKNRIENARNATVFIQTDWGSIGSGVIVTPDCWVLTNKHVLVFDDEEAKKSAYNDADVNSSLKEAIRARQNRIMELLNLRSNMAANGASYEEIQDINKEIEALKEEISQLPQMYKESIDSEIDVYKHDSESSTYKVSVVDQTEFDIQNVTFSESHDLAAFQLPASGCPFVKLSSNRDIPLGTRLYTVGNPSGLDYTVTSGVFSGYRNSEEGEMIQTDAPINPGNSGGPLITEQGDLVGINTMILLGTEGIGFAIPAQSIENDFSGTIAFVK